MAITAGADTLALRQLGKQMEQAAAELRNLDRRIDSRIAATSAWKGSDSHLFRTHWSGSLRGLLNGAVNYLEQGSATLVTQAEEQERVSESDGASGAAATLALAAGAALGVAGAAAGGGGASGVPVGGSPKEAHAWWKSLTADERAAYIREHPGLIGNMDGIPASARDQANRRLLDDRIASLEAERGGASGARRAEIDRQLADLESVDHALDTGSRPSQLLLLDLDGPGMPKAAVAIGDVDSADNVAVFTPGISTTVKGSLGKYVDEMVVLWDQSNATLRANGQSETVATIAWLGYEFPPGASTDVDDLKKIANIDNAAAGGRKLATFVDGLSASHDEDPHVTLVGHSHGSAASGAAAQMTNNVDAFVAMGSPGIMTNDVSDLNVPKGNIFVIEAKQDYVADLGWFGGADPNQISGVESLSAKNSDVGHEVKGHSKYLMEHSTSLYNVASVVTDNADDAIRGGNSGAGDGIRWIVGALRTEDERLRRMAEDAVKAHR